MRPEGRCTLGASRLCRHRRLTTTPAGSSTNGGRSCSWVLLSQDVRRFTTRSASHRPCPPPHFLVGEQEHRHLLPEALPTEARPDRSQVRTPRARALGLAPAFQPVAGSAARPLRSRDGTPFSLPPHRCGFLEFGCECSMRVRPARGPCSVRRDGWSSSTTHPGVDPKVRPGETRRPRGRLTSPGLRRTPAACIVPSVGWWVADVSATVSRRLRRFL